MSGALLPIFGIVNLVVTQLTKGRKCILKILKVIQNIMDFK